MFNIRMLCEKYHLHQPDLLIFYLVFKHFKKAFDRVCSPVWDTMRKFNITAIHVGVIEYMYNKFVSTVLLDSSMAE